MMKAVVVRETGGATSPKSLSYETDYPKPILKPGHAVVKNMYAGINFIDTYHRSGLYPRNLPFICGQEGGGTIDEIMSADGDESSLKVGDLVVYSCFETYAEYTLVPVSQLIKVPSGLDIKKALACMVQGLTAHYLVSSAHAQLMQKDEWCLIYSVGSGTCQWAAQMAKLRGYKVIGTCSKSKVDNAAISIGCCDEIIILDEVKGKGYADYHSVDIVQRVMDITNGEGVKCVIDGIGKTTSDISLNCLARRGIFISFGNASGKVEDLSLLRLVGKSAFVTRPKLNDYCHSREELLLRSTEVFQWVIDGKLDVSIDKEFDLADVVSGHQYIESGMSRGKLLYKI